MTEIQDRYQLWLDHVKETEKQELLELSANKEALNDAFYQDLSFGTAGFRGIIGLGTNRMNVYTVGQATQGLANYLLDHFQHPAVIIARDSRIMGEEFVRESAGILAANGVHVLVFEHIAPTPLLSFGVRDLDCAAGINVTASHNPKEYNGYKVYGPDGCQIRTEVATEIQQNIAHIGIFSDVVHGDFDEQMEAGNIDWVGEETSRRFIDAVAAQSVEPIDKPTGTNLKVVYTPLNGTGLPYVLKILERIGVTDVTVVPEQADPDGAFPTCPYPNPEMKPALERGLALCEEVQPDLLLATDPDADRVGIAVKHEGAYELLTGNEVGILLLDYVCARRRERGEDLADKVAVTTIVSSLMPDALARAYGFQLRRVLTGFKYIGGQITALEQAGEVDRFIFGYEESYGYMSGAHVRDKDSINASMLICQMARWHKSRGKDLVEALQGLYEKFGYYLNRTLNFAFPGESGALRMKEIMDTLRLEPPSEIAGKKVEAVNDFSEGVEMPVLNGLSTDSVQMLPPANVVEFMLGDGIKVLVRPSGTEPKIKFYLFSREDTKEKAENLLDSLEESVRQFVG